ncbi:unnamed protein product, partial [Strongylus vulgaris]
PYGAGFGYGPYGYYRPYNPIRGAIRGALIGGLIGAALGGK